MRGRPVLLPDAVELGRRARTQVRLIALRESPNDASKWGWFYAALPNERCSSRRWSTTMDKIHIGEPIAQAAIEMWNETAGFRIARTLCPIYAEGVHRPEPVGTATLIRVDELVFLVSAAHVLDDVGTGPRYFGGSDRIKPLPAITFRSPLPDSGRREDDLVDVGYWVLDPGQAHGIPSADTLRLDQLDLTQASNIGNDAQYYLSGYPASRQPRRLTGDELEVKPLQFLTDEAAGDVYEAVGTDRIDHVIVDFDKDDFYSGFEKRFGPDLFGVSGGVIWRLTGSPEVQPQSPLLTAIVTSWRRAEPRSVIGTRMHLWLQHASSNFPAQFERELQHLRIMRA